MLTAPQIDERDKQKMMATGHRNTKNKTAEHNKPEGNWFTRQIRSGALITEKKEMKRRG